MRWIEEKIKNNISTIIVTPNPEMLMAIQKNSLFLKALQTADKKNSRWYWRIGRQNF